MGYCEGVIGNFNAESVHFVELDPRVLESLDADLDFATDHSQYRNSSSSYDASSVDPHNHHFQQQQAFTIRDSLQSYSSSSDQYTSPQPYPSAGQTNWAKGKPSFESIGTNNSSIASHVTNQQPQQHSQFSNVSYSEELITGEDPYDTSAFNIDYSDEEQQQQLYPATYTKPSQKPPSNIPSYTNTNNNNYRTAYDTDGNTTDDNDIESMKSSGYAANTRGSSIDENYRSPTPSQPKNTPVDNMSVDEYGFVIKPNQSNARIRSNMTSKFIKEYRENELKWLSIVNKLDAGTVKKDAKFKKLVRNGIPASVRSRVWQFLAGSNDYRRPNQFNILVDKPRTAIYDVIERDIARCYPDHTQFMDKNGQGQKDLSCVLKAYSQYNSHLEYCQGMGRLAGLMLMQMSLEDTFWLLVATIDRYMNGYFTPTLSQLRIDAYIIGQLLKDHQPKLAQHLESNDVLPIMYIAQWFLTAFTMTLPWDSVLRVWDAFYFEGK
jgi:hypothetical protein